MKKITVLLTDGSMITAPGEVMFDSREGTLTLLSDEGGYSRFNWNHVQLYIESEMSDDDE